MTDQSASQQAAPAVGIGRNKASLAIIALAVVLLACIGVSAAVIFTLIDKVPWHHLWDLILPAKLLPAIWF
jgi:hypothetical protein